MCGYIKIRGPPLATSSNPKDNNKLEILRVKIFSLKQETNQILPATIENSNFASCRKQLHILLDKGLH